MENKFNVFVSYSWKDSEKKDSILNQLEGIEDINLIVDHINIPKGEYIFKKISQLIDEANILLVLLSHDSVQSLSVRDELILAYERGCDILEVCIDQNCKDLESSLPSFLENRNRLSIDDNIPQVIIEKKEDFYKTGFKYLLRKEFSKLRQHIKEIHKESEFDNVILRNILNKVNSEAKQIGNKNYEVDLSRSSDFLRRAGSIFHSAANVYAVTVSWISDFWNDDDNANDTYDYLIDQKENTIRLFVFDKPEEVKKFQEILDANYEVYGVHGAVLITSKEYYEKNILDQISVSIKHRQEFINKDFGVLTYTDFEIYAWLDKAILGFTDVSLGRKEFGIDHDQFKNYLKGLQEKLEVGSFFNGIYRWSGEETEDFFVDVYNKLFPTTSQDTINHIILFKDYNIVKSIAEIKSKIEQFSHYADDGRPLECIDVWYGRINEYSPRDDQYVARLIKDKTFKYALIMKFKNEQALKDWYNHPEHSSMRRKLYSTLSSKANEIYKKIDTEKNQKKKTKLFREIEQEMKKHIRRIDYTYEYNKDAIEHIKPYSFFQRFQARKRHRGKK